MSGLFSAILAVSLSVALSSPASERPADAPLRLANPARAVVASDPPTTPPWPGVHLAETHVQRIAPRPQDGSPRPGTQPANQGAINPADGTFYAPAGDGLVNTRDGTYMAPAGPNGYIDTRTGRFVPTN